MIGVVFGLFVRPKSLTLTHSRHVPSHFIDSQERVGVTGESLYVSEVDQKPRLVCSFLIIFEGLSWSLTGGVCNDEVQGDIGVGIMTSRTLMEHCHPPLIQVVGLLETEAVPSKIPGDGEGGWSLVNGFSPKGRATRYDRPSLSLDDHSVSSRDCKHPRKTAAPTIMVGVILETRGKVPLKDKSSEPPITRRLSELGIGLISDPKEPMCHPTVTETMDEVLPFGNLISPARTSPWQPILSQVGGA